MASTQLLIGQESWSFDHKAETLTVAADGSISISGDSFAFTLGSSGTVNIASKGFSFSVADSLDFMIGRGESVVTKAPLRVVLKRPTSLSAADLAGNWVYKQFLIEEDANGPDDHGFETFSANTTITSAGGLSLSGGSSGSFTIDSDKHMALSIDGESLNYGVNASKDLMVSVSTSETGIHVFRLFIRLDSGGLTSQLAGNWTIRDLGVDKTPGAPDLWKDTDPVTITSGGNATLAGESATVSTTGSGTVNWTDSEGSITLALNQSRNLLVDVASDSNEYWVLLAAKHPSSLALSQLAGIWDLYELVIDTSGTGGGEDPKNGVVNTFHADGTTLAIRETWVNDKLHGEPAVEQWDQYGNSTLTENYNSGVLNESTTTAYNEDGIGINSIWYLSYNPDGSPNSDIYTSYHSDGTTISSITTTTYPNGDTKYHEELFRDNGVKRYEYTEVNGKFEGTESSWNADGKPTKKSNYLQGILLNETSTHYRPNGTVSYENTSTFTGGTERSNEKRWNEAGVLTSINNTHYVNGLLERLSQSFDELGNPTRELTQTFHKSPQAGR